MTLTQALLFAFVAYLVYKLLTNFSTVDVKKLKKDLLISLIKFNLLTIRKRQKDFEEQLVALRSGDPALVEAAIAKYQSGFEEDIKELEEALIKAEDPRIDSDSIFKEK